MIKAVKTTVWETSRGIQYPKKDDAIHYERVFAMCKLMDGGLFNHENDSEIVDHIMDNRERVISILTGE